MPFRSRSGTGSSGSSMELGDIGMRRSYSSALHTNNGDNMAMRHRTESLIAIEDRLNDVLDNFCLSDEDLVNIEKLVENDIREQLSQLPENRDRMLPTYVVKLPDGTEVGNYIVLDFGGRFFRVAYVNIKKSETILDNEAHEKAQRKKMARNRTLSIAPTKSESAKMVEAVASVGEHEDERGERVFMESAVYPMSKRILDSPAEELFNHISKLCASFIKRFKLQDQKLPVALVSSFPCRHESLRQAKLIRWTKGVKSEGAKGKELGELLQGALNNVGCTNLEVKYIINDSVACLFSGLSEHPNTKIGLIIGNGFNISFLHKQSNDQYTVINSELGSIGEDGELAAILTEYDTQLQKSDHCHYKNQQTFEKMLTTRYVPELFRIICMNLTKEGLLFNGISSPYLDEPSKLPPDFLAQLIKAGDEGLNQVQDVLFNVEISAMYSDADAVVRIAKCLMLRAAALVAASLAGVIRGINHGKKVVAISADGSTWKSYPKMADFIKQMTQDLVGTSIEVQFRTSFDGSAKGAAFIAAKHEST